MAGLCRGVHQPQPGDGPEADQNRAIAGIPAGDEDVRRIQDDEEAGDPGRDRKPAAASQQAIRQDDGQTEQTQIDDVVGNRVQAKELEFGGA